MVAKPRTRPPSKKDTTPARELQLGLFHDVVEAQMDLWKKWSKKAGTDMNDVAKEVAPIVAQHWANMFATIWSYAGQNRKQEDPLKGQDELRKYMLVSYNEMMKKVLATKAFAARSGNSVKGLLSSVKAWNEVMEETLRALHLPTRGDIDELHEALYGLNKRVDYLARSLQNGGSRRIVK